MATFQFIAKNGISPKGSTDSTQEISKFETRTISIGNNCATPTTLFSDYRNRDILAQQLNKEFGVTFFNKNNVQGYFASFQIKKV